MYAGNFIGSPNKWKISRQKISAIDIMNILTAKIADQKVISSDICPEAIPLKQKSTYLI